MAPRILIFSIVMDADNSFYVKFIATEVPTFFGYIISVLAMVINDVRMTIFAYKQNNIEDCVLIRDSNSSTDAY